jgi:glyoxylase-like metal-dependent hydrolase (beta-lactamase superfamily II)
MARDVPLMARYWTTAYLVDGLLIDSGCAHTSQDLLRFLDAGPLERIANTHSHEDHIGANGILQRARGAPIMAHELALPVLADPRGTQPLHPYRKLFWGWPEPSRGEPIADGDVITTANYRFEVIHTPGHSPDHCCFFEPQHGWLFSGDLFVGGRERALRIDYDIWGIIGSLKRIADLPIRSLFPGSARVRHEPGAELLAKISYLEEIGGRIQDLSREGWSTARIARTVLGKSLFLEYLTLGHFTRRGMVDSYLRGS